MSDDEEYDYPDEGQIEEDDELRSLRSERSSLRSEEDDDASFDLVVFEEKRPEYDIWEDYNLDIVQEDVFKEKKPKVYPQLTYAPIQVDEDKLYISNLRQPWCFLHNDYTFATTDEDDNLIFPTITHFLYASVLTSKRDRSVMTELTFKKAKDYAYSRYVADIHAVEEVGYRRAYSYIVKKYPELLKRYQPYASNFIFNDPNPVLGKGSDGKGLNMIGKVITSLYIGKDTKETKTIYLNHGCGLCPIDDTPFTVDFRNPNGEIMTATFGNAQDYTYFTQYVYFTSRYVSLLTQAARERFRQANKQRIIEFRDGQYKNFENDYLDYRILLNDYAEEKESDAYESMLNKVQTRYINTLIGIKVHQALSQKINTDTVIKLICSIPKKPIIKDNGFLGKHITHFSTKYIRQYYSAGSLIDMTSMYTTSIFKNWTADRLSDVFYNCNLFFPEYISVELTNYNFEVFMDQVYSPCEYEKGITAPYPEEFYNQVKELSEQFKYGESETLWQQLSYMKNEGEKNLYKLWCYISNLLFSATPEFRGRQNIKTEVYIGKVQAVAANVFKNKTLEQCYDITYKAIRRIVYIIHYITRKIGHRWGIVDANNRRSTDDVLELLKKFLRFYISVSVNIEEAKTDDIDRDMRSILYKRMSSVQDRIDAVQINKLVQSICLAAQNGTIKKATLSRIYMYTD